MKTKYPRHPERFAKQCNDIRNLGPAGRLDFVVLLKCRLVLSAYYGGEFRVAIRLLRDWAWLGSHSVYWSVLIWISDRVGWTVLRHIPDNPVTREHWERHGGKCDHLNCQDDQCIKKSLPKWFKWITRWHAND